MATSHFSSSAYMLTLTLKGGHSDTINCLAFSTDGAHLASGGDDNALIIWSATKGQLLYRLLFKSAVDCILWHPVHPETVIVGLASGFLFQLYDFSLLNHQQYDIHLGARNTVHCLDYDAKTRCLAIGMGEEVHMTRETTRNSYTGDVVFPAPPELEPRNDQLRDERLRPIAVRFHKEGTNLIVSYLAHGIICWDVSNREKLWNISMPVNKPNIGGSALSPDHRHIAVYNVADGLDLYAVGSYGKQKPRKTYKFSVPPRTKHRLQVQFIHNGKALICGTTTGALLLWEVTTGEALQDLSHGDDVIQAVSATVHNKMSYITTGTAAKGQATCVKIWRAKIAETGNNTDYQVGDAVAEIVQAVAVNRLFQPEEAVRQGIAIAVTVLICLLMAWACVNIPWFTLWNTTIILLSHISVAVFSTLRDLCGMLYISGQGLMQHALDASSAAVNSTSVALRHALLEFLFPDREHPVGAPAQMQEL